MHPKRADYSRSSSPPIPQPLGRLMQTGIVQPAQSFSSAWVTLAKLSGETVEQPDKRAFEGRVLLKARMIVKPRRLQRIQPKTLRQNSALKWCSSIEGLHLTGSREGLVRPIADVQNG